MYINRAVAIIASDWEDDAKTTGKSFKSWKSCQNNRTCHIIAIVGIVLAALCIFWVLSTLIRCLCMGYSCLEALCCCCCRNAHSNRYVEQPQQVFPQTYSQHYTHQREPPMTRAEPAYQPMNQYYPAEKATTPQSTPMKILIDTIRGTNHCSFKLMTGLGIYLVYDNREKA